MEFFIYYIFLKNVDFNNINNYRDISVISCLGKFFIGFLQKCLDNYFELNNLLSKY